ncbi:MAG: restriction endonuclease subunit S [Endozoicomonas sp.]|uniref:restriction endonuclease subunit S n=1 Tax=Endozoicomonas sp. TaxID=1892382 RepID=UPI003D9B2846
METELNQLAQSVFLESLGDPVINPKGWERYTVCQLGIVQGGLQVSHRRVTLPIEVPYLRVANVYRERLDLSEVKTIKVSQAEKERVCLESGDVLIVEGHGNKNEIGRCAVWDASVENCVHQNHLIRVRFDRTKILPEFASLYLNSEGGRRQLFKSSKTTSGLNTISANNVKNTGILVPPLKVQENCLSQIFIINEQKNYLMSSQKEYSILFHALTQKAFKGELTLPDSITESA